MNLKCYHAIIDKYGWRIGSVEWRVKGYIPLAWKTFDNQEDAEAKRMNEESGVSEKQAFEIVGSSMWPEGDWKLGD